MGLGLAGAGNLAQWEPQQASMCSVLGTSRGHPEQRLTQEGLSTARPARSQVPLPTLSHGPHSAQSSPFLLHLAPGGLCHPPSNPQTWSSLKLCKTEPATGLVFGV